MSHDFIAPIIVLVCCACGSIELLGQWLDWRALRRFQQRRRYSFQRKDPK